MKGISSSKGSMLRLSGQIRIPEHWFGKVLKFQVTEVNGNEVTLRGQGKTFKARTTSSLQLGQEVQVKAETGKNQVILRLLGSEKTPVEVLKGLDLKASDQRLNLVQELIALKQPLNREVILGLEKYLGDVKDDPLGHLFLQTRGIPVTERSLIIWRFLKHAGTEANSLYVLALEEYTQGEDIPYTLQYWGSWPLSVTEETREEKTGKYLILQVPTENLGMVTVLLRYTEMDNGLEVTLGSSLEAVRDILRGNTGKLFQFLSEDFHVEAIDVLATKEKYVIKGLDITV